MSQPDDWELFKGDVHRRLYALEAKDVQVDASIRSLERSVDSLTITMERMNDRADEQYAMIRESFARFENTFSEHTKEERAHWNVEQFHRIERERRDKERLEDFTRRDAERMEDYVRRERELQIESRRARRNELIAAASVLVAMIGITLGIVYHS